MPSISLVVIAQGRCESLAQCVQSFTAQKGVETIVVAGASVPENVVNEIAGARVIRSQDDSFPRLARLGMQAATGDLVGFSEWHCTADGAWADRMREVFAATSAAVVGGSVLPQDNLPLRDRALFAVDYGPFVSGTSRVQRTLPGVNIVFKRSALDQIEARDGREFWKSFVSWELERQGERLLFDPGPRVMYHRRFGWPEIVARRWNHGRCFGSMRRTRMPPVRRILYPLIAPLLPFILTSRTGRVIRSYSSRLESVTLLPPVFLIHLLWIAGEWTGHIFGAGGSCDRL